MNNKNPIRGFTGGRASRAEVYGLFIAAIVIIGGGVSGAMALANSDPLASNAPSESNTSASSSPSQSGATPDAATTVETQPGSLGGSTPEASAPDTSAPVSSNSDTTTATSSCPYTLAEQTYYNNIRATKQAAVDQAQTYVDTVNSWISSNTAHLDELLAAPYRPIEVFQWKPDGTPYVWRVDSNEEIAFERQRIADNHSELTRAHDTLQKAIADRDQVPGC